MRGDVGGEGVGDRRFFGECFEGMDRSLVVG